MRGWLWLKGMKQDARHWRGLPEEFAARTGARVVPLDPPGVGSQAGRRAPSTVRAMTDDLRVRWLEERGDDGPWGMVGLSLGGMVTLDWAARYPDDFAVVVLGNTSAGGVSPPWHRMRPRALAHLVRASRGGDGVLRERAFLQVVSSRDDAVHAHHASVEHAAWQAEIPATPRTMVSQLLAGARFRAPEAVRASVHVIVGEADRLVDPRCGRALATRLGAVLHAIPGAGHDLSLDAPRALLDVLAEIDAESGSGTASSQVLAKT